MLRLQLLLHVNLDQLFLSCYLIICQARTDMLRKKNAFGSFISIIARETGAVTDTLYTRKTRPRPHTDLRREADRSPPPTSDVTPGRSRLPAVRTLLGYQRRVASVARPRQTARRAPSTQCEHNGYGNRGQRPWKSARSATDHPVAGFNSRTALNEENGPIRHLTVVKTRGSLWERPIVFYSGWPIVFC